MQYINMNWERHSSGVMVGTMVPVKAEVIEVPEQAKYSVPSLEWFLGLEPEQQKAIWSKLRAILKWSGWIEGEVFHAHGHEEIKQFFEALRDAGASWEELT